MKTNKLLKVIITIVSSLIVISAFIVIDLLNETALAPLLSSVEYYIPEDFEDPDALLYITETPPEMSEPPSSTEPEEEPKNEPGLPNRNENDDEYIDPGYVLFRMDESEISRGHLILVNHDHEFVFPDDEQNDLISINEHLIETVGTTTQNTILSASIITPFNDMMSAFHEHTSITNVVIRSAFRSIAGQQTIFNDNVRRWGRTGALLWASRPGHSEHHTGLAFDLGIRRSGLIEVFEGTGSYAWIPRNSHNYGFILRYPRGKTAITQTNFEPWHYRYVGIPHATIMRTNNWVLEEYIEKIKNYTFEEPYLFEFNNTEYIIYFTSDLDVKLPYDVDFIISGNNVDGFIITAWKITEWEEGVGD